MPSLKEKRRKYALALENALDQLLNELRHRPEVERVILIGSYAQGKRDLLTDLDVIVVMRSDQDFVARTAQLYGDLNPGVDIDLLVYTPAEFEQMRERGFLKSALKEGEVLYEKKSA